MTARAFFRASAVDGRAVLAGPPANPRLWLVDIDGHLVLCRRLRDEVTFIADSTVLPTVPLVSATQLVPCGCWFCDAYDGNRRRDALRQAA
jgi:hypothetical protein